MHGKDVGQTFLGCIFGIFHHLDAAVSENSKVPHQLESTNDNNLFSLSDNAIRQAVEQTSHYYEEIRH